MVLLGLVSEVASLCSLRSTPMVRYCDEQVPVASCAVVAIIFELLKGRKSKVERVERKGSRCGAG